MNNANDNIIIFLLGFIAGLGAATGIAYYCESTEKRGSSTL